MLTPRRQKELIAIIDEMEQRIQKKLREITIMQSDVHELRACVERSIRRPQPHRTTEEK